MGILRTITTSLGIAKDDTTFDKEIILLINSIFPTLHQMGVGPVSYRIVDDTETWEDYVGETTALGFIQEYITLNVKLLFDPPLSSTVIDVINKKIAELEFRINVEYDKGGK